jgi:Amt family ammonium transporter
MTPGLAFFYGGLVRGKNVLSTLMRSFVACGRVTVQWVLFGYSLAFGPDHGHLIGDFSWAGLHGVSAYSADPDYSATVPHQIYCMFQLMFAIITPALISGAIVERMKFSAYCLFMLLWATFVYDPLAHWVWGAHGWLGTSAGSAQALDFAGGSVVHMSSGFSALTLALMLGKRRRSDRGEELRPHNLPMTAIGTALLWFGWFGFNAGSAVNAGHLAISAFTATHIATGTAALTWMILDWVFYKKPSALGFCSGAVAGLVAITPACGFVSPLAGMAIGVIVSCVCFACIRIKNLLKADDALDVFGIHGCGGLTGCLCTGLFASAAINSAANGGTGHNGLLNGGSFATSMLPQLMDAGSTIALAVIGTFIIGSIVKVVCGGLRTNDDGEADGLDLADHGESGYSADSSSIPAYLGA